MWHLPSFHLLFPLEKTQNATGGLWFTKDGTRSDTSHLQWQNLHPFSGVPICEKLTEDEILTWGGFVKMESWPAKIEKRINNDSLRTLHHPQQYIWHLSWRVMTSWIDAINPMLLKLDLDSNVDTISSAFSSICGRLSLTKRQHGNSLCTFNVSFHSNKILVCY